MHILKFKDNDHHWKKLPAVLVGNNPMVVLYSCKACGMFATQYGMKKELLFIHENYREANVRTCVGIRKMKRTNKPKMRRTNKKR